MHSTNKNKKSNYGILYVVATPIGNINDMTYRAIEVLSNSHIIATENTRHSKKLLNFYGIKIPNSKAAIGIKTYMERIFEKESFKSSLTESEKEKFLI